MNKTTEKINFDQEDKQKNLQTKDISNMQKLVDEAGKSLVPIKIGEMTDVTVFSVSKSKILVDVGGFTTGFIPEKEFSSDAIDLKPGDKIPALVLMLENEDKQVVLSLKKASKERYWQKLEEVTTTGETVKVRVKEANRGGLMVEYGNIEGFLPVSHLSSDHYPKVGDNKERILAKLKILVGKSLIVKPINLEVSGLKAIFSEKEAGDKRLEEKLQKYKVGQQMEGTVTGIVDFGVFVSISMNDSEVEGLVHISEISWNRVDNIGKLIKVGDKIKVQVIDISNNKLSLSIKRLQSDPWLNLVKDYQVGDKIKGEITKITPYGAFVGIGNKVTGMFHVSELAVIGGEKNKKIEDLLDIGKEYDFVINSIDVGAHKIGLSWDNKDKKQKDSKETSKSKTKETKKKTKIKKKTTKTKIAK